MHNALKDGRLKFDDKEKPHPKEDVKTKVEALFIKLVDNMVVDIIDEPGVEDNKENYEDQASKAYPKDEE